MVEPPQDETETAGTGAAAAAADETPPAEREEALKRQAAQAKALAAAFGEIVSVLLRSPAFRHYGLADLEWLVIPALQTGQFSLAEARSEEGGLLGPVGVVLWASVSEDVDRQLSTELRRPIRIRPDDWQSGDAAWLIAAVGPQQVVNGIVDRLLSTTLKGRTLKMRAIGEDGAPAVREVRAAEAAETPADS